MRAERGTGGKQTSSDRFVVHSLQTGGERVERCIGEGGGFMLLSGAIPITFTLTYLGAASLRDYLQCQKTAVKG